jgi:eukaryotic translation initiation factor 2C
LRPNHGNKGKQIEIKTNHFSIQYNSSITVYHYDIAIEPINNVNQLAEELATTSVDENDNYRPEESKKRFRKLNNKFYRHIVEEAVKQHSGENKIFENILPVFDGLKNLYSAKEIKIKDFAVSGDTQSTASSGIDDIMKCLARIFVEVVEDGRSVKYALMLKLASIIDMRTLELYYKGIVKQIPHECLQVLNILLRHGPTLYKIPIGNSLYSTYNEGREHRTSNLTIN